VREEGEREGEREREEEEEGGREDSGGAARNFVLFLPVNVPRCSQARSATASGSEPAQPCMLQRLPTALFSKPHRPCSWGVRRRAPRPQGLSMPRERAQAAPLAVGASASSSRADTWAVASSAARGTWAAAVSAAP
jgi:hypothetical protein